MGTNNNPLSKGLRQASRMVTKHGQAMAASGAKIFAAGAAPLAAFGAATAGFASAGDQLDKMSMRTGIGAEELSQLGFAAEQSGADLETLGGAVLRMNRRLGRITQGLGSGSQVSAMEQLGLDAATLDRMDPLERLLAISDAMTQMQDKAAAAGLAQRAFGTQVDAILPLLLSGRDGIRALMQEADELGLTISQDTATQAAMLTDAMNRTRRVVKQVAFEIGGALAPQAEAIAGTFGKVSRHAINWVKANRGLVITAAAGSLTVAGLGAALLALGGVAILGGAALSALAGAAAFIVSPIGLALAGVAGLTAALVTQTDVVARATQFMQQRFGGLAGVVKDTLDTITALLGAGELEAAAMVGVAGVQAVFLDATSGIRTAWVNMAYDMAQALTIVEAATGNLFDKAQTRLQSNLSAIGAGIDILIEQATKQGSGERLINQVQRFVQFAGDDIQRTGEAERRAEQREKDRNAQLVDLSKARQAALEESAGKAQEALQRLEALRAESEQILDRPRNRPDRPPAFDSGELAEAIAPRLVSRGTFGTLGLAAGGSAEDRTATATEQVAKHTAELARKSRSGGLTFA